MASYCSIASLSIGTAGKELSIAVWRGGILGASSSLSLILLVKVGKSNSSSSSPLSFSSATLLRFVGVVRCAAPSGLLLEFPDPVASGDRLVLDLDRCTKRSIAYKRRNRTKALWYHGGYKEKEGCMSSLQPCLFGSHSTKKCKPGRRTKSATPLVQIIEPKSQTNTKSRDCVSTKVGQFAQSTNRSWSFQTESSSTKIANRNRIMTSYLVAETCHRQPSLCLFKTYIHPPHKSQQWQITNNLLSQKPQIALSTHQSTPP